MAEHTKYKQIFEYLSSPAENTQANGNFVFGRNDQRLAERMAERHGLELASYFLITGGAGKDSGDLKIPEAEYIQRGAIELGVPSNKIHTETKAGNGGENARFGLKVIQDHDLALDSLTVLVHATSLLRAAETIKHESIQGGYNVGEIYRVPTNYPFDPTNPADQQEARDELLRLDEWPELGWLQEQPDLQQRDDLANLVEFARAERQKS